MTDEIPELTNAILDRFRAGLRHAGVPLGDQFRVGLTNAEIDEIGVRLGVATPPELRTLWSWGTAPPEPTGELPWRINHDFDLWPTQRAIRETQAYREGEYVPQQTIVFAGRDSRGFLMIEAGPDHPVSPVTYAFLDDPSTLQASPSLGALFSDWAGQLERRDYYMDEALRWQPAERPNPLPRRSLDD